MKGSIALSAGQEAKEKEVATGRTSSTEYHAPKIVDEETFTKGKHRTAHTQEDENISRCSTIKIRNLHYIIIARMNTREILFDSGWILPECSIGIQH